jgi:hypothetical protein
MMPGGMYRRFVILEFQWQTPDPFDPHLIKSYEFGLRDDVEINGPLQQPQSIPLVSA